LENDYIFNGHLEYFLEIWGIVGTFGTFFPVLVSCTKTNLAALLTIAQDND
jgi:hypothetical protein